MISNIARTVERYKSFLGIRPDAEIDAEADALKRRGDFTDPPSPDDYRVGVKLYSADIC